MEESTRFFSFIFSFPPAFELRYFMGQLNFNERRLTSIRFFIATQTVLELLCFFIMYYANVIFSCLYDFFRTCFDLIAQHCNTQVKVIKENGFD